MLLFLVLALLGGLVIAAAWLLATPAGLQWAYAQARDRMPGTLEIERLEGRLIGPIEVHGARYASDDADARVGRARLAWSPLALLAGRLDIDALAVRGARIVLKQPAQEPPEAAPRTLALPFRLSASNVELEDVQITRGGQPPYQIHSLELTADLDSRLLRIDRLRLDAQGLNAAAEGALGLTDDATGELRVRWRAAPPGQPALEGRGRIAGNLARLQIDQRLVAPIEATVRARVNQLLDDLTWQIDVDIPEFETRRLGIEQTGARAALGLTASGDRDRFESSGSLQARLPELPPVTGRFALHGSIGGAIVLERLALQPVDSGTQVTVQGRWLPDAPRWEADIKWRALQWPLAGEALVKSPSGILKANGNLERYRLQLDAATTGENLPPVYWAAAGSGDRAHVVLEDVRLDMLGTTLEGTLRAAWSPALEWQARLRGSKINPAVAWPEWPGSLALDARVSGDADEARVRIETLRGTLREQRFAANARVVRRGEDYPALALELRSGGATARASGSLNERWDLVWSLSADNLGNLLPQAAGRVHAEGRVADARATPRVDAELSAAGLVYAGTRIERMALDASLDLSDRTRSRATLQASGGALLGRPFERVALEAAGYLRDHRLAIEATFPGVGLQARIAGGYAGTTWRGRLHESTLRVAGETWALAGRPALVASADRFLLEQTCWRADAARMCVEVDHASATGTALAAAAERLPLALFGPLLPGAVEAQGTVSGTGQARVEAGRLRRADAHFELSPGSLVLPAPVDTDIDYEGVNLDLVVDAEGLRAEAALRLPGGGGRARVALPRFHAATAPMRQPIEGHIAFEMQDLSPLAPLLPRLEALSGRLQVDLALAGTPADPRLRGTAALADAAAHVPASGIRVHGVRLTATAAGGDELQISGEAHSGGGRLALSGEITFPGQPAWRARLRVAGSEFQAADLGKTQVYVSPDLTARLVPGEAHVTGQVRIPRATFTFIAPQERDIVRPSPDVVIVNAPEQAPPPPDLWNVTARIRVILGDAVRFVGFGLNAGIAGEVLLMDAPGEATTARGELRVAQGQYEAYGQTLEIERGRLLFAGGPVANPGLDARAVRRVDQVTAGVDVKGTLQSPELALFSDPPMNQADALSYLLFGRPIEGATTSEGRSLAAAARALQLAGGERLAQRIGARFGFEEVEIETGDAQETAALVLGRRLSPRLYINYSIGLFEPSNVLRLRYQLTPNWSLEAQSGSSAGGDLLYTLER